MTNQQYSFDFEVYNSIDELQKEDAALLSKARAFTTTAYAPYSHFFVAAVATLNNGEIVSGTNQENASYPVGICAERALLASASAIFPNVPIQTMAITYHNQNPNTVSNEPVSPCGMCRQALLEYEGRWKQPIRLILSGMGGKVYVIAKASSLLPLSFTSENLGI